MKHPFPTSTPWIREIGKEIGKEVGEEATKAARETKEGFRRSDKSDPRAWTVSFSSAVSHDGRWARVLLPSRARPFLFLSPRRAATDADEPELITQINANVIEFLPPVVGERMFAQIENAAANWKAFGLLGLGSLVIVAMGSSTPSTRGSTP